VNRLGGTIADSPSGALVRIADGGGSGDINMAASGTTSITALMQNATGGEATVNIGTGNMLRLGAVGTALLPSGKSALTFNDGTLTAGGNADNVSGELLVNNESTANPVIINSVIADNGTGIVTLGKAGAGTLVLNGANTYSGPTAVTGGVVSIPALADAGSASGIGTGTTIILDGGTLRYTGGAVSTNRAIQLGSSIDGKSGTLDASGTGAVNFTTSFITYGTTKQRRTLCLAGTNTGANTMAATIRDNGVTNASAPVSLVKSGPGQWVLTGTNSYSGGTVVEEGVLQIAGFGTPGANSASSAIMVAAGASLEFNRFSGLVLANPISGEGSVVVSGTAPLSFNCGNSFSGGLVINSSGGVALFFNSMSAPPPSAPSLGSGPITMANNTSVDIGGFTTVTGLLDTSGTGSNAVITTTNSLPPPPTLTISGPGIHTFAGRITGNMSLIKDGAGIQFLNGANTYTGPTYIDGGILGGTGSISGAVYLNVGGAIAPGHSIGTFTLGSLDISSGVSAVASGALEFELDTPVASDKITLTAGPLAIGAGVLEIDDFQFTTSANFGPGTYTLIHGASPIVGSLGPDVTETIDGLDATLAIGNGGTDLVLNVVPEPASLVLAVTALGAVMICRAGAKLLS
jgi:fibronectin-binding autotransporter adhesin